MSASNERETTVADDITEDLTVDGADLLAALRAEHAARQTSGSLDGGSLNDGDEDLTIDGRELLLEIKRSLGDEGRENEHTIERWRPAPVLPPSDAVVAKRAGRPSRLQLGVIVVVVGAALAVGGSMIAGIVSGEDRSGSEAEVSE